MIRIRLYCILGIMLFWLAAYCRPVKSDDMIHLPRTPVLVEPDNTPVPSSEVISTLAVDQWYVVESTSELIALQSPLGIVDIEPTAGPIKVRGRFVDGTGANETRTYSSPYVYFVTAKTAGKTELILIPSGVTSESDIVRQVLTVSGVGPQPPPEPDPDPKPPAPGPVSSFRVIFVVESGQTLPASQTGISAAKSIREYLNRKTTPENGVAGWREYDPQQSTSNEQPTMKALWAAVQPKIQSVPCLVIEVNGNATVMPYPASAADALKILQTAGGQ